MFTGAWSRPDTYTSWSALTICSTCQWCCFVTILKSNTAFIARFSSAVELFTTPGLNNMSCAFNKSQTFKKIPIKLLNPTNPYSPWYEADHWSPWTRSSSPRRGRCQCSPCSPITQHLIPFDHLIVSVFSLDPFRARTSPRQHVFYLSSVGANWYSPGSGVSKTIRFVPVRWQRRCYSSK